MRSSRRCGRGIQVDFIEFSLDVRLLKEMTLSWNSLSKVIIIFKMQQFTKQLTKTLPLFDIAANLTDDQFGQNKHHM